MTVTVKKILLRYYPPGLLMQYIQDRSATKTRSIDLLDLTPDADPAVRLQQLRVVLNVHLIVSSYVAACFPSTACGGWKDRGLPKEHNCT